jgi:trigger factor
VRQKPNQVRKAYERNDAVVELKAELRKRKALGWLLDHVEIVDDEGRLIERSLIVPGHDEISAAVAETSAGSAEHDHDHPQHGSTHDQDSEA